LFPELPGNIHENKDFNLILTQIGLFVCGCNAPSYRTRASPQNIGIVYILSSDTL